MAVFCVRILTSISWSFYFCPRADFQNGGRQNVICVSLFLSLISTSYWTNTSIKVLTSHSFSLLQTEINFSHKHTRVCNVYKTVKAV